MPRAASFVTKWIYLKKLLSKLLYHPLTGNLCQILIKMHLPGSICHFPCISESDFKGLCCCQQKPYCWVSAELQINSIFIGSCSNPSFGINYSAGTVCLIRQNNFHSSDVCETNESHSLLGIKYSALICTISTVGNRPLVFILCVFIHSVINQIRLLSIPRNIHSFIHYVCINTYLK